jgi:hypothetical protein
MGYNKKITIKCIWTNVLYEKPNWETELLVRREDGLRFPVFFHKDDFTFEECVRHLEKDGLKITHWMLMPDIPVKEIV